MTGANDPTGQTSLSPKTTVMTGNRTGPSAPTLPRPCRTGMTETLFKRARPLGRRPLFVLAVCRAGVGGRFRSCGEFGVEDHALRESALQVDGASAYDPFGDGSEKDSAAKNVVDGDLTTNWTTEGYGSQGFQR